MPTLILYNGPIYTLIPELPVARALAIRDGQVLAVGSEGKVQAAVGGYAEGVNLRGRAAVPGLIDAHVHITWHGLAQRNLLLHSAHSLGAALERIGAHARKLPAGAWLSGAGWNQAEWGGQWPTAAELDRVCADRPALLSRRDGHSVWVNSRALALAGIDDTTPDPPGGQIQRDRDGKATGILLETAQELVRRVVAPPTAAERQEALRAALAEALSYGLTGLHLPPGSSSGDGRDTLSDLKLLYERGQLPLRCLAHIALGDLDAALALGLRSGLGDRWLRVGGLKIFADGTLGSETAEMLAHYEGRRHLGMATIAQEELEVAVLRANQHGLSVVVHAIGDAANRKVLSAIAKAQQALGQAEAGHAPIALPNRIEHAQIVHPKDIARFAALGVIASMQPIHATTDMAMADQVWGARCATAYAWRALQEAGATLAFGSDAPLDVFNPWAGVHAAVTRQRADGTPPGGWYPAQRLSLADALRAYCVGPAVASGEARRKGTLAPGMLADIAVLGADPFHQPPEELHRLRVDMTIVEGRVVYERKA